MLKKWLLPLALLVGCLPPTGRIMSPEEVAAIDKRWEEAERRADESADAGLPPLPITKDQPDPPECKELIEQMMEAASACIVERNDAEAQGKACTDDGKVCPSCKVMNDKSAQALAAGCHAAR